MWSLHDLRSVPCVLAATGPSHLPVQGPALRRQSGGLRAGARRDPLSPGRARGDIICDVIMHLICWNPPSLLKIIRCISFSAKRLFRQRRAARSWAVACLWRCQSRDASGCALGLALQALRVSTTIYVGNLSFFTTEEQIFEVRPPACTTPAPAPSPPFCCQATASCALLWLDAGSRHGSHSAIHHAHAAVIGINARPGVYNTLAA